MDISARGIREIIRIFILRLSCCRLVLTITLKIYNCKDDRSNYFSFFDRTKMDLMLGSLCVFYFTPHPVLLSHDRRD